MRVSTRKVQSKDDLYGINDILTELQNAVNAVEFWSSIGHENIICDVISSTTPSAGGAFSLTHTIGKTPSIVIPFDISDYCRFKTVAGSAHDSSKIYLEADTNSVTFKVIVA